MARTPCPFLPVHRHPPLVSLSAPRHGSLTVPRPRRRRRTAPPRYTPAARPLAFARRARPGARRRRQREEQTAFARGGGAPSGRPPWSPRRRQTPPSPLTTTAATKSSSTPAPDPEDGGGGDDLTRAEGGRVVGKDITTAATKVPSPSPDSTISSHHDGRHQVVLSSPPGTPAPDTEDGGSNNLSLAVSLLSLTEAGLAPGKAGSAPSVVDHSPSPPDSAFPIHDDVTGENKWTHVRFLVSHAEAGLIIGTGGSAVATVEARSGARIKLSRHDELLPGTDRRVVLVSGLLSQVMDAMELLLEKLLYQGDQVVDSQPTIVLMVPQPCCGVLIGKGGSVIKSLTEVSEAVLQISPQNISYGLNDRLVTITGPLDSQLRAVFLTIFELLEDARYSFAYATATPNTPMRSPVNKDAQESLTIAVADEYMGAVIGRAGRIINEISKVSGACIDISAKGEFIPGTLDREVSISGTSEAIRAAEVMIMHRVSVANGDGGKFTRRRVEGSGKGLLTMLDEEADAIMQMHQLNLSDESVIQ